MDKYQKERFGNLVKFLGDALSDEYEIVLHDIDKNGSSVCAIENSHISGRTVNSPLTGFALELLKNKVYEEKDYLVGYKSVTSQGKYIQGSTFFIKNDKKIAGMLCINYDNTEYKNLSDKILKLGNIVKSDEPQEIVPATNGAVEQLSESIEDIIASVIEPSILHGDTILKPEKKQEIVTLLFNKGVFNIKGAVLEVSKILNMSEQSVYRYLKKVEH